MQIHMAMKEQQGIVFAESIIGDEVSVSLLILCLFLI